MFRTELTIAPVAQQLPPSARVLTLGSCFADSIGARLAADKVNVLANPFGTVFQPLAMGRLLRAALGEDVDWQQHLVEARGRWQSYDLHGSQGAASPVELLHDIQQTVQRTGEFLRGADAVLLTLGTAWAYRLRETGELVSNCHQMPAELFEKELLTPDEIINALAETHAYLRRINPKLRIVLTVSPVRHLKDTLPLNAVSKSVLRVACHYLSELLPDVSYFPAYELLTDDLRDYRFYAADMLHPSEVAQDYIWEKFARTYFDADFGRFRKEWAELRQALGHRPLNAAAPAHRQFLESTRERLERLGRQRVNVAAELREVDERLATLPVPAVAVIAELEPDNEERIDVGTESGPTETPTTFAERPLRPSPDEFRAQRAARNQRPERGRGAAPRPAQPATDAGQTPPPPLAAADSTALVPTLADGPAAGTEPEAVAKKKRRSRGGAKRTARKNAAKLVAAAADGEADAPVGPVTATDEAAPATTPRHPQPEAQKSGAVTKSVPVKRGGRDRGRSGESTAQPDAPTPAAAPTGAPSAPPEATAPTTASVPQPAEAAPAPAAEPMAAPAGKADNRRKQGSKARPLFAVATGTAPAEIPATTETVAAPAAPADAPAGKAAAEKMSPPAIPPVTARPAGVAAGRMRGSAATLVANEPDKSASNKKAPAPRRKATKPAAAEAPAAPAPKRPAKPRAKKATPPDSGENSDSPA